MNRTMDVWLKSLVWYWTVISPASHSMYGDWLNQPTASSMAERRPLQYFCLVRMRFESGGSFTVLDVREWKYWTFSHRWVPSVLHNCHKNQYPFNLSLCENSTGWKAVLESGRLPQSSPAIRHQQAQGLTRGTGMVFLWRSVSLLNRRTAVRRWRCSPNDGVSPRIRSEAPRWYASWVPNWSQKLFSWATWGK